MGVCLERIAMSMLLGEGYIFIKSMITWEDYEWKDYL